MDQSTLSPKNSKIELQPMADLHILSSLKFVMENIKSIVSNPLSNDNYTTRRSHILKLFKVNGYIGFLDGTARRPGISSGSEGENNELNPEVQKWILVDQNLTTSLFSRVSKTILHMLSI